MREVNQPSNNNALLRKYRIFLSILLLLVIFIITRSAFELEYLPFKDLLVNEEIVSPNNRPARLGGSLKLRHYNVTILGMGRDIAESIPSVFDQMITLGNSFNQFQILFVEGNSKDDTMALFLKWKEKNAHVNVHFITTPNAPAYEGGTGIFKNNIMPREGRIAHARNIALKELYTLPPTDYVIMIDLDILGWDNQGILDSFSLQQLHLKATYIPTPEAKNLIPSLQSFPYMDSTNNSSSSSSGFHHTSVNPISHTQSTDYHSHGWDVMCSNGIILHGVFRDTYAFRSPGIDTNHHKAGMDFRDYNLPEEELPVRKKIVAQSKELVRDAMNAGGGGVASLWGSHSMNIVRADSCFGGLAIYRYDIIQGCEYSHRHPEPPYFLDCEHVLFHRCISSKNGAKIFSNPDMKLWYGHSPFRLPPKKQYKQLMDWLFPPAN